MEETNRLLAIPPEMMDAIPAEHRPVVLAHLLALQARLIARMSTEPPAGNGTGDQLLSIEQAMERVGLADLARRPLSRLSGGQQQRAFIAKALVSGPQLLALDEPTAGVDVEAQEALSGLLARLNDELGVTILYVSHEFGAIEHVVRRLVLVRGGIVFDGPPSSLPGVWHDPEFPRCGQLREPMVKWEGLFLHLRPHGGIEPGCRTGGWRRNASVNAPRARAKARPMPVRAL